jgi:hypothetical protein
LDFVSDLGTAMKRLVVFTAAGLVLMAPALAASLVDYDGNGAISREEFRNAVTELAYASDANNDGILDGGEFPWSEEDLKLFDTNGDGKITSVGIQEFQDGMAGAFDALDANADDSLDAGEIAAAEARFGLPAPN